MIPPILRQGEKSGTLNRNKTPGRITRGLISPKRTKERESLDKSPGLAAALLSPKYNSKPVLSLTTSKRSSLHAKAKSKLPQRKSLIETHAKDPVAAYAAKTRAGCTSTNAPKINQDSYACIKDVASLKNYWLFGVFDGHGLNGHFASDHVKQFLPANIELVDYTKNGLLSNNLAVRQCILREAFIRTSDDIKQRSFNISFSGSTAVTVFLMGDKLMCANVGDSRAVLASYKTPAQLGVCSPELANLDRHEKIWVALPLSRDHKPDDEEEYKRIMKANGRVEPFRELTGETVGPNRVWLKNENVPGLAMSRSVGDKVASQVGVIPDPEIYETIITSDDKFIVIASDGIWEFLENDKVVEMVVPYWHRKDPEGACQKLVQKALYHWQHEDEVVDDITVIVIFLAV